jgi:hypothetical protein
VTGAAPELDAKELYAAVVESFAEGETLMPTIAEKWVEQGVQQGLQQGEAAVLRRLLSGRFDPLPEWAEERLTHAEFAQLEAWADRVLDADTLMLSSSRSAASARGYPPGGSVSSPRYRYRTSSCELMARWHAWTCAPRDAPVSPTATMPTNTASNEERCHEALRIIVESADKRIVIDLPAAMHGRRLK